MFKTNPSISNRPINSVIRILVTAFLAYTISLILNGIVWICMKLIWREDFVKARTQETFLKVYFPFMKATMYVMLFAELVVLLLFCYIGYKRKMKWYEIVAASIIYIVLVLFLNRYCFPIIRNWINGFLPTTSPAIDEYRHSS